MLVLSRKEGESVIIGDHISVTVLSIEPGGQVNIGISAPRDVLVLRSELQKAVSENQSAADTAPAPLVELLRSAVGAIAAPPTDAPSEKN
ncbi:MAG: carbon storage regulator [Candidatus Faecalibacterium intestinavium]|uniref:Translational regulator CsrA n=1 Tax=Candidatus Faecalibacterium intestinavium TaxID=2838580 RepID=A0A9E2KIU0_9FIRM|nr:carbon storage regulator [Candidatus Faecalibacterium intestinavium]